MFIVYYALCKSTYIYTSSSFYVTVRLEKGETFIFQSHLLELLKLQIRSLQLQVRFPQLYMYVHANDIGNTFL